MNDPLEKKVKENLSNFDQMEVIDTDLLWADFDRKRESKSSRTNSFRLSTKWYAIAASVTVLIASFTILQSQLSDHNNLIVNNLEEVDQGLAEYQKALVNSMDTYANTIESLDINTDEYPDIAESLDQVERLAISYQNDLKKYGPDPKIIKAILKCAKQKVELYEMLLYQLEIKSYHEKKSEKFKV